MRIWAPSLFLLLSLGWALGWTAPAAADWLEYRYDDPGFAVWFPAAPKISDTSYRLADGSQLSAKLYSAGLDGGAYTVTVADFSGNALSQDAAIGQAVDRLGAGGAVQMSVPWRVNRAYGREISVAGKDGSYAMAAVFYVGHKLFQVEAREPSDAQSSDAQRFEESLSFVGGDAGPSRFGRRRPPPEERGPQGFGPPRD